MALICAIKTKSYPSVDISPWTCCLY